MTVAQTNGRVGAGGGGGRDGARAAARGPVQA